MSEDYAELMRNALRRISETEAELDRLRSGSHEALALCAMSCRFPGASSPEQFWDQLAAGQLLAREIPRDRWEVERWFDPDPEKRGRSYSRWACFIEDVAGFDAGLFGLSRREAQWMDPQQRILLELVWELFERVGDAPDRLNGKEIGVFVGASSFDYLRLATADLEKIDAHTGSGAAPSALAGRIAYAFGLGGPTFTVDTACSSSLVALHLACQALRQGECDAAIVAGSSLMLTPHMNLIEARTRMLAPDGRCKSFAAEADGVVRGEGIGAVLLRREHDARAMGSPILSLIKGSAVNQNGRSASLTTPHVGAQQSLLRKALGDAGLEGSAIEVVEAHGTGTALGDPIEVAALGAVLGEGRLDSQPLWIGSVKPNIGHLEAAAGIAGVMKLSMMIERGQLLPSVNVDRPSPAIDWESDKISLIRSTRAWPGAGDPSRAGDERRYGGVSAFGFAGTNAHAILSRSPVPEGRDDHTDSQAEASNWLGLSARSSTALTELARAWAARLRAPASDGSLADLCFTAKVGRAELDERLAVVGERAEIIAALERFVEGEPDSNVHRAGVLTKPALLGYLVGPAELGFGGGPALSPERFVEPARRLDAQLTTLEADIGLSHSFRAIREAFVMRVAQLAALVEKGFSADEITGVGPGKAIAAWLAQSLPFEQAVELAWLQCCFERVKGEQDRIVSVQLDRFEYLDWRAPERGLVTKSGTRVQTIIDARRWLSLTDPDASSAEEQAAHQALIKLGMSRVLRTGGMTSKPHELPVALDGSRGAELELEASVWVRGHARWNQSIVPGKRVLAPTYPFEHREYWLPGVGRGELPPARQMGGHPLLGTPLAVVDDPRPRFSASIASDTPSWLGDHRVFGEVVVPAAAWVEVFLAAGDAVGLGEQLELEDVELLRPLTLAPGRSIELQTVLEARGDRTWEVKINSVSPGHTEWTQHACCLVRRADESSEPTIALRPAELDTSDPQRLAALYDQARGVEFGPSFRVLDGLVAEPAGTMLGSMVLAPELIEASGSLLLHPVALDACLRVIANDPGFAVGDDAWLPLRIARIRRWRSPARSTWCRAEAERVSDDRRRASACCFTNDGVPCFEVEGVELVRRSSQPMTSNSASWRGWVHALQWRPLGSPTVVDPPLGALSAAVTRVPADADLLERVAEYSRGLAKLEVLAGQFVANEFATLGGLTPGVEVELEPLRERWGFKPELAGALARLLTILVERGELEVLAKHRWRVRELNSSATLSRDLDGFVQRWPALRDESAALRRCGTRLAEVLRGEADPLELLMDGDARAVEALYRAPMIELKNRRIHAVVGEMVAARHNVSALRVLEIGAGTGATTTGLVDLFDKTPPLEYCFTDVSAAFLESARERFGDRRWFRTERLDLDQPVPRGGASLGRYDVIIASNVLHVTRDLRASLTNVQRLLAPGGTLILMEGAVALRWVDLSFGLTPGWWRFTDHNLRSDYPLLLRSGAWAELLAEQGFSDVEQLTPVDANLAILSQQAVIVARSSTEVVDAAPDECWVLVGGGEYGTQLRRTIEARGQQVVQLGRSSKGGRSAIEILASGESTGPTIDLDDRDACAQWFKVLNENGRVPTRIVHLWGLEGDLQPTAPTADLLARCEDSCVSALGLIQATLDSLVRTPPAIWMVTRGAVADPRSDFRDQTLGREVVGLHQTPLWGLGRVLGSEHPELACRRLDIDPEVTNPNDLFALMLRAGREDEFALREGNAWVPRLVPATIELEGTEVSSEEPPLGTVLVTGGLGGVGLETARWLANRGVRHIALLGRSEPRPAARATLASIEALGVEVRLFFADVSDFDALDKALEEIRRTMPPLRQVFHSAGVIADATVVKLDWPRMATVLAPKLQGAWNLHLLTEGDPIDKFVLFSSAVAQLRASGQANHCAANTFLGALAHHRKALGRPAVVIDWGAWENVGAAARPDGSARMHEFGMGTMPAESALAALAATLESGRTQVAIMPIDWQRFVARQRLHPLLAEVVTSNARVEGEPELRERLGATISSAREGVLRSYLREQFSKTLGLLDSGEIDDRRPLFELGLDSLMAIELRNHLIRVLGISLPTTLLFDFSTVEALSGHLLELFEGGPRCEPRKRVMPVIEADPTSDELDEIGELDLNGLQALIDAEFDIANRGD